MELVDFTNINRVVLNSLNITEDTLINKLSFIGEIYFRSYHFSVSSITLKIPFFSKEYLWHFERYIKFLDHMITIYYQNKSDDFAGCFIINFFDNDREVLRFRENRGNVSKWGDDISFCYTKDNAFIPVYFSNDDHELSHIHSNLRLYQKIREEELVKIPVGINLDIKNVYIQEKDKSLECFENGLFKNFRLISKDDVDYMNEIYDEIHGQSYSSQISVLYPYFSNVSSLFIRNDIKNIQFVFHNRFTISTLKEISDNDLIILPTELVDDNHPLVDFSSYFSIVKTTAGNRVRELLKNILEDWENLSPNRYIYPFPKYFILLICKGESLDYWISLFVKYYPFIADRSIFSVIVDLISVIYEIDWSSSLHNKNKRINFIFHDLDTYTSRSRILREPYGTFKQYHTKINKSTIFSLKIIGDCENYILNSFDINFLINQNIVNEIHNVKIIIPDFLYFNINPFGLYQLYNFQFISYFTKLREKLIPESEDYKSDCEFFKNEILVKSRIELKKYINSFHVEQERADTQLNDEISFLFDEVLDEVEEAEKTRIISFKKQDRSEKIIVDLVGEIISFRPQDLVYVFRTNFLRIKAAELLKNDMFLNFKKVKNNMKTAFLNQLEAIPESVKYFKHDLYLRGDSFNKLKRIGLKITGEDYFNSSYISNIREFEIETFKLPRKEDRNLICEFLNIDPALMQIAYIAKYKNNSEFKRLYSLIMDFLIDGEYLNASKSDFVKQHIIQLLNSSSLDVSDEYSIEEFAMNIVNSILNNMIDYIEPIMNLNYETESQK